MSGFRCLSRALFLVGMACMADVALAQQQEEGQQARPAATPDCYAYQAFLPRGYAISGQDQWPLLIFLHGSGERGDDIEQVKIHGPPKIVADHPGFPFVTISPQLPAGADWDLAKLDALLAHIIRTERINPTRIYLTGLSLGGHASWRWAAARPGSFAAVAPVSGRGEIASACALSQTPVWAFHGDADTVVPPAGSFAMVQAIRVCGGDLARLTIYPATGHDAWTATYHDSSLYRWMLEQRGDRARQANAIFTVPISR